MLIVMAHDNREIVENFKLALNVCCSSAEFFTTGSGDDCLRVVKEKTPNLILVKSGLSNSTGIDIIKQIRAASQCPIVALTPADGRIGVISDYEAGADVCIDIGTSQLEIIARIRALLRKHWAAPN